jgi:hypothetical protein
MRAQTSKSSAGYYGAAVDEHQAEVLQEPLANRRNLTRRRVSTIAE